MKDTVDKTRAHVAWNVNWKVQDLASKVRVYEQMQGTWGGLGLRQTWASLRLTQLLPSVLWWTEIKLALESDDPNRVVSALERLIRHYRSSNFFLTWFAPLSGHVGLALLANHFVSENIREATALREHYRQLEA